MRPANITTKNRILRFIWNIVWLLLFRPSPRGAHRYRCILLRIFGAKLDRGVHIYPSAKIWAPWNLVMYEHSCIGDYVDCYSVDTVEIGAYAVVSQYTIMCTASHDYSDEYFNLVTMPIIIGSMAWVAADVFLGPGADIGVGSVVGARSSVYKKVSEWSVVGGNPARFIRKRNPIDSLKFKARYSR